MGSKFSLRSGRTWEVLDPELNDLTILRPPSRSFLTGKRWFAALIPRGLDALMSSLPTVALHLGGWALWGRKRESGSLDFVWVCGSIFFKGKIEKIDFSVFF